MPDKSKKTRWISLHTLQAVMPAIVSNNTTATNDNGSDPPKKKPGPKPGSRYAVRALTREKLYKRPEYR